MTKKEMQKLVTLNGKPLPLSKFSFKKNVFQSNTPNLVVQAPHLSRCTFVTSDHCTFDTSSSCTFETGICCTFKTGDFCTFETGSCCTFDTRSSCTWVYGTTKLEINPIYFHGSRYSMQFLSPGLIKSGCITKPLEWWEQNITRCAEEHAYTPAEVKEYELYVKLIAIWMRANDVAEEPSCN